MGNLENACTHHQSNNIRTKCQTPDLPSSCIGRGPYERLRARAMVLLLRYTALRISDVATLEKDRVRHGEIFVRTAKNGKPVRLPMPADLQRALDVVPTPRGTGDPGCPYFFWSGHGGTHAVIRDARRTLEAVYSKSGVEGACSHRFRHTLATEALEMGATLEEVADILGDTEAIVRKHYAKWSAGRQARISDLLARIWHAKKPRPQVTENEIGNLVDLVRFELTTSSMPWWRDQSLRDERGGNKRLAGRVFGRHLDAVTSPILSGLHRTPDSRLNFEAEST